MSKTANVLEVLRLFSAGRQHLRPAEIMETLGISSATAYRYIAELEQTGLIENSSPGRYVLGPAIVELDRQIRLNDPLIAAAAEVMKSLSERSGGTTILARLHGLKVVCVDQVKGRRGPPSVSYERGRAMPLYRGATSTVILAHLDDATVRRLAEQDATAIHRARLPQDGDALLQHLAAIRAQGVAASDSAVDADTRGWAAPVFQGKRLLGSLSVVMDRRAPDINAQNVIELVRRAALRVQARLADQEGAAPT
jgi:DNA-binding IclR family transcriptional regulator